MFPALFLFVICFVDVVCGWTLGWDGMGWVFGWGWGCVDVCTLLFMGVGWGVGLVVV